MPKHRSILIVEDEIRARDGLTKKFLSLGNLVVAVCHPRQALEAATIHDFDVAIIDQSLPEIQGILLIPRLRGFVGGLKVVLLSGDPDDLTSEEAVEQGADAFLHKPCFVDDVEVSVDRVLANGRLVEPLLPPRFNRRLYSTNGHTDVGAV